MLTLTIREQETVPIIAGVRCRCSTGWSFSKAGVVPPISISAVCVEEAVHSSVLKRLSRTFPAPRIDLLQCVILSLNTFKCPLPFGNFTAGRRVMLCRKEEE